MWGDKGLHKAIFVITHPGHSGLGKAGDSAGGCWAGKLTVCLLGRSAKSVQHLFSSFPELGIKSGALHMPVKFFPTELLFSIFLILSQAGLLSCTGAAHASL